MTTIQINRRQMLPTGWLLLVAVTLMAISTAAQDTYGAANPAPSTTEQAPPFSQLGSSPPSPPASAPATPPPTPAATPTPAEVTAPPAIIVSNDINVGLASSSSVSTDSATNSPSTPADFGLPPLRPLNASTSINRFDTSAVYGQTAYDSQSPLSGGEPQAERRTFDFGGGDGGGGGGIASGLTSILTPIAGAAAAALTAGGGASLLSLPNANIQPTLQKTFVLNLGPHNPPLIVQGNAFQPGASAGATINNHGRGSGGGGGGGYSSGGSSGYGRSDTGGRRHYQPQSQSQPSAAASQIQERGYVAYPNSPGLPQVAAKLGIANLLSMAKSSGFLENLLIGGLYGANNNNNNNNNDGYAGGDGYFG